ncbi:MAG: hypothetical protein Q4B87_02365 [Candidatus Saccharibacteria bacterium]|nr:hypothetical protein [Candidatus Saccharibacteria bacterium]
MSKNKKVSAGDAAWGTPTPARVGENAAAGLAESPRLARRRLNKRSTLKSGRTIGERRERLETSSERLAARNKVKKRQDARVAITIIGFIIVIIAGIFLVVNLIKQKEAHEVDTATTVVEKTYSPTIEVVDENGGGITARMSEYIGQAEGDFREKGLIITRAVIPAGAIREVDFYLDGVTGFIKTTIDRSTGVTAEDAERMLRYLTSINVSDFTYIDVRIDGKAYWK